MSGELSNTPSNQTPESADAGAAIPSTTETVRCSLTGKEIAASDAYWAPPLITVRELVTAVFSNIMHAPGTLGSLLWEKQPDVPYDPEAREELASRRTAEQAKLLLLLLIILALIAVPIFLVVSG